MRWLEKAHGVHGVRRLILVELDRFPETFFLFFVFLSILSAPFTSFPLSPSSLSRYFFPLIFGRDSLAFLKTSVTDCGYGNSETCRIVVVVPGIIKTHTHNNLQTLGNHVGI